MMAGVVTLGQTLVLVVIFALVLLGRRRPPAPEAGPARPPTFDVAVRTVLFGLGTGAATGGAFGAWLANSFGLYYGSILGLTASIVPTVVGSVLLSALAHRCPDGVTFTRWTRTVCAVFGAGSAVVVLGLAATSDGDNSPFVSAGVAAMVLCCLLLRLAARHIPAGGRGAAPDRSQGDSLNRG